jgi:hypothetical protein
MKSESSEYDIFLSYARADNRNNDQYVEKLARTISEIYRQRTGRELRIFLDLDEIATAQEWESRIHVALRRSSVMVSVLSPSYFASYWCGREWDSFIDISRLRSIIYGVTPYLKLIFPVTLRHWASEGQLPPETRRRVRQARGLQYVDFAGVPPGTERFATLVARLVDDLIDALGRLETVAPGHTFWPDEVISAASPESPTVTTRRAQDRFQFIRVLADAINVTIVGITNENLADFLDVALELKRNRLGPAAFWESLRIVFLREDLLDLVNDEAQRPRAQETFRERRLRAKAGKRAVVSFLIRQDHPEKWSLHEYEYFLPFLGVLFGMADGTNLVQITMARPRQSVSAALYFELVDPADQYFTNAFRDVIADSKEENEVILVGTPDDGAGFHVTGATFRRGALREGQNVREWLPSVVIVAWTVRNGMSIPLLQVRTEENATHYIHHLSHIGGYVNESDLTLPDGGGPWPTESAIILPETATRNAARRELHEQMNLIIRDHQLRLFRTCRFYNYDRENLFFYLYTLQVPNTHRFPVGSQVRTWRIEDLLRLHEYQVLCKAEQLLRLDEPSATQRAQGARILALQLTLHGQYELGDRLVRAARRPAGALADTLSRMAARRVVQLRLPDRGTMTSLEGLAEIHYREFFSIFIPLYAQVGVPDAASLLDQLESSDGARNALAKLSDEYGDDDGLSSLPFEV